jgi:Fic family protein
MPSDSVFFRRINLNEQKWISFGERYSIRKSPGEMQQEVRNYWRALEWIEEQTEAHRPWSEEFILELHCIIVVRGHGRRGQQSKYRDGECPVVDAATRRIDYGPPKPGDVPALMRGCLEWLHGTQAQELPGPLRTGLLAHRFVSIHPFSDGNGRTARALATTELWRSGYDMRGFLSLEEHYTEDINTYYDNLQMGLPVDFYEGRHDPDHTRWLDYFLSTMAKAAEALRLKAIGLYAPANHTALPWEGLHRIQQQLITRLLTRGLDKPSGGLVFSPADIMEWYGVSAETARDWLRKWRDEDFVVPVKLSAQRIHSYVLAEKWAKLVQSAMNSAGDKKG